METLLMMASMENQMTGLVEWWIAGRWLDEVMRMMGLLERWITGMVAMDEVMDDDVGMVDNMMVD